jgi:S-adenosylmethionine-diacylglycerol 3-amino-3-carboxypropyl transferase
MSLSYFNTLNYTLANEDTTLEYEMIADQTPHVMAVAGSGGRVLPLLARHLGRLTCVDVSLQQLFLTELRIESLRALDHAEFLTFWGYPPRSAEPAERKELFARIALRPQVQEFFTGYFASLDWESILYAGKWEKAIAKLSKLNRTLTGVKGLGVFGMLSQSEQKKYMATEFPTTAWNMTMTLIGQAFVFNSVLYKGSFPKKNIPEGNFEFYSTSLQRVFALAPARESFLLQLFFYGKIIYAEANPIECRADVFAQAKAGLKSTEVRYELGSILDMAAKSEIPIDFLSLSDVPSYFSGETEKGFMQMIRPGLTADAIVVVRNYLRIPEGTNLKGYVRATSKYTHLIQKEKVQLYKIDVFQRDIS